MNTLYVILVALVTYTSDTKSDSIGALSAGDFARYCYYCSNCPLPFNPYNSLVTRVTTKTGWCAMMSTSNAPGALASRGTAQLGLCNYFGCQWRVVSGVIIYVCCCNSNLCNGDSSMTTTIRPYTAICYYCSTCSIPFIESDAAVSEVYSSTGWCVKMGTSSSIYGIYTRGAAKTGLCKWNGCTWKMVHEVNTYVCCCNHDLCNTGVSTSQPIGTVLNTAFVMTIVAFKSL